MLVLRPQPKCAEAFSTRAVTASMDITSAEAGGEPPSATGLIRHLVMAAQCTADVYLAFRQIAHIVSG